MNKTAAHHLNNGTKVLAWLLVNGFGLRKAMIIVNPVYLARYPPLSMTRNIVVWHSAKALPFATTAI